MSKIEIKPGMKFGRWTVIKKGPPQKHPCGKSSGTHICKCDCGTVRIVGNQILRNGGSKSCGCLKNEISAKLGRESALPFNENFIKDKVVYIKLSNNKIGMIDQEDLPLINSFRWNANKHGHTYYMEARKKGENGIIRAHNIIMNQKYIDHIDGNGLNNCKSNLRIYKTRSQNQENKKITAKNTTGYKGVYPHQNKFVAQCQGKYIGIFSTPEEAAKAYDKKAEEIYGDFAWLNFPKKGRKQYE